MVMGFLLGGNDNVLKLITVVVLQPCRYTNTHGVVHFTRANCMVCELYLNKTIIFFKK